MGSVSYWQAESDPHAPPALAAPPLRWEAAAEVVVIGGGITGAALALWLGRAGARVVVLEGRTVAAGASGRNGGFLLGGLGSTYAAMVARHGREGARRLWAFSIANHALMAQAADAIAARGWLSGYRRLGILRLATTERELAEIQESARLLLEDGWETTLVGAADLPGRLWASYLGGAFLPDEGEVQPVHFVRGLARLAVEAGAVFHEASPVTTLEERPDHVLARTADGTVRAERAVLATNAWLPELLGPLGAAALSSQITAQRGQMLATEPIAEELFPCPCDADEGYQYWRQLADGRLLVGGWRNHAFASEAVRDETPGPPVQDHLERFVRQTLGLSAAQAPIAARWAGVMAFSSDGLPLVGPLPASSRCYVAGAYNGRGNAYALAAAQLAVELLGGGSPPDADLFDPARFDPGR
jgi:gamma-glutamylputrescine oxidase